MLEIPLVLFIANQLGQSFRVRAVQREFADCFANQFVVAKVQDAQARKLIDEYVFPRSSIHSVQVVVRDVERFEMIEL